MARAARRAHIVKKKLAGGRATQQVICMIFIYHLFIIPNPRTVEKLH